MATKTKVSDLVGIRLFRAIAHTLAFVALGSGLVTQVLTIPFIPVLVTVFTGWVVLIAAVLDLVVSVFEK